MRSRMLRSVGARLGLPAAVLTAAALTLLVGSARAASPDCLFTAATGQTTCTFEYTGTVQSWTAPADVTGLAIEAWGGQGGVPNPNPGEVGGSGGHVTGSVAVARGAVLDVTVAQDGASDFTSAFGGGGASHSGGGGGASSVAVEGGDTLVIAAGGGGAGGSNQCPFPVLVLGGNGGNADADGQASGGCDGTAGSVGGKAGASATSIGQGTGIDAHEIGGAGGGGYLGGGVGQSEQCLDPHCQHATGGGGGGGGTNYLAPSATATSTGSSDRSYGANGVVTITYSSAGEQLASLLGDVTGVGPGRIFAVTVGGAQWLAANGHTRAACLTLALFKLEVRLSPRLVTPAQSASFIGQATNVGATIGC